MIKSPALSAKFKRSEILRQQKLENEKVLLNKRRNPSWVLDRLEKVADILTNPNDERFDPRTGFKYLEALGRYHKLFTEKVEISVREDLGEKIRESRRRSGLKLTETLKLDAKTGDQTIIREIEISPDTQTADEMLK